MPTTATGTSDTPHATRRAERTLLPPTNPAPRTRDDGQTSTSWRMDSIPRPPAPGAGYRHVRAPSSFDEFDDDRDYPAVFSWTAIWYALPVVLYIALGAASVGRRCVHALHSC